MNTLRIEAKLAEKYKYKPLPGDLSEKYRGFFTQNIPYFLSIAGGGELYTCCGCMICKSYVIIQLPIAIAAAVILISESKKSKIPCKTCRYLKTEGCGNWKYVGTENVCPFTRFDKPPKYCSSYVPRDKSEDSNV